MKSKLHSFQQTQSIHFTNSTEYFIGVVGKTNHLEHYLKLYVTQEPPRSYGKLAFTPSCH